MELYETKEVRVPVDHQLTDHDHDSGMKDKWFHMRSRGMEALSSMKHSMDMELGSMRDRAMSRVGELRYELKSNPMRWAGIAAGAGFGLGLLSRSLMQHAARRKTPHLLIVESAR